MITELWHAKSFSLFQGQHANEQWKMGKGGKCMGNLSGSLFLQFHSAVLVVQKFTHCSFKIKTEKKKSLKLLNEKIHSSIQCPDFLLYTIKPQGFHKACRFPVTTIYYHAACSYFRKDCLMFILYVTFIGLCLFPCEPRVHYIVSVPIGKLAKSK